MSISNADIAFVKDFFAGVSTLTARKMLGGLAVYADRVIFALIIRTGALMLKAKGALAQELTARTIGPSPCPTGHCQLRHWMSQSWPAIGPDAL
jgi:TfoX/Sxy family transcriptional regulator of competence genes